MVTQAEEAEGFPPLLAEMLWRGNFSRRPEYSVFARGLGPGMVDYVATVFIPRRFVEEVTEAYNISAHETSIEMVIQEVAYKAIAILRQKVIELERQPFTHFPIQEPLQGGRSDRVEMCLHLLYFSFVFFPSLLQRNNSPGSSIICIMYCFILTLYTIELQGVITCAGCFRVCLNFFICSN